MRNKLIMLLTVILPLSFTNNLYSKPIPLVGNSSNTASFGVPAATRHVFGTETQASDFVDMGDYYFLNTGKKKSFLRKKSTYLIIFKKRLAVSKLQNIIQTRTVIKRQFGNRLNIIKDHPLKEKIMFQVKQGENPKDIVSTLFQTDPSIDFISPVLSDKTKEEKLAVIPHIIVNVKKDENPDSIIMVLQDQYKLSLVSKLSFTDNEYEFKIEEQISDIGRIFEITRMIAELPSINWAEPNFIASPKKEDCFPDDTYFINQWHLHNTGQNGAAADADIDAPEGWNIVYPACIPNDNTIIAIFDDGVDTSHEDLFIWSNPGETGNGKESNGIDDDGNGYIDDYQGWDFSDADNDPNPSLSSDNHGTAVAGVAGAIGFNTQGVSGSAADAAVLPVRMISGTCSAFADAMRYAGKYADVVNNSWTINSCESSLDSAISDVVNGSITGARRGAKGTPVVFASGNNASGWRKYTMSGLPAGTFDFRWRFSKDYYVSEGYDTMWLDDITWPGGSTTDFESDTAGNIPTGFTSGGAATWAVVSDGIHARGASGKSVKAGSITHNQQTYLDITQTVGTGSLTFWVWVSSEQNYDFFEFYVDGTRYFQFAPGQYSHVNSVAYPALNADTIAVGASNDGGISGSEERSYYSQFGSVLDVVAPSSGGGQGIYSTDRMGASGYSSSNYYDNFGGTSSATPLVAGIIANLISYDPTLTAAELRTILQAGCDQIGPYGYVNGRNDYYGYGRVNLLNSLDILTCAAEVCDGVDNNCDGNIDEGGNALCDDGNFCNGSETCNGIDGCQPGPAPDCNDNNPCTIDSCDQITGCINTPMPATLLGDINNDGRVDGRDLSELGRAFGATLGDPQFDCLADLNNDNIIDGDDLIALAANFGQTLP